MDFTSYFCMLFSTNIFMLRGPREANRLCRGQYSNIRRATLAGHRGARRGSGTIAAKHRGLYGHNKRLTT